MSSIPSYYGVVRALGPSEVLLLPLVAKSFTAVYNLTVSTTKPFTDDIMKLCLQDWRDHYPVVRVAIRETEGTKYFCEDQSTSIDYELVQEDWLEVFNCMLNTTFSETGPMWRVKLIDGNTEEFPYTYTLLIIWNHVITDGTFNITMCNGLMEILDTHFSGQTFETKEVIKIHPPIEDLLPQKEYLWSEVVDALKEDLALAHANGLWSHVFPATRDEPARANFIDLGYLNKEETERLVARCKAEGTTVHAALLTAANVALHRVYTKNQWTQNNIAEDKMTIVSGSAVNLRRCAKTIDVLGYYVGVVRVLFETSSDTSNDFWKSAKDTSKSLREKFKAENMARNKLTIHQLNDGRERVADMKENQTCRSDYGFSNMRDVKSMFPGVYKHVEVTWLARSTGILYYGIPVVFYATTFRGRLLFSVDFVTNHANEEIARFLGKEILSCLRYKHFTLKISRYM